ELGKELAARKQLAQAVSKVDVPHAAAPEAGQAESTYRLSSDLLASIPIQSRDILVTTITKKLSQAAIDFKAVQRDITNSLRTAESLIHQAPIQARPSLESAIKQLDNAIDRKSTRLNSSHVKISYAVFCLKKKTKKHA